MIYAKTYEITSKFEKVMPRTPVTAFFPHGVAYTQNVQYSLHRQQT